MHTVIWFHVNNNDQLYQHIGRVGIMFANGPGDLGSIPGCVIPKTLKIVLDTQQYKVRIKGKVEQSREWSSTFPIHLGVVAIEKGAFWSPSTMVANLSIPGNGVAPSPTPWCSSY